MILRDGRFVLLIALVIHALFLASLSAQFLNPQNPQYFKPR